MARVGMGQQLIGTGQGHFPWATTFPGKILNNEIMGVIAKNKNEIRFYYSSESSVGKQVLGFIHSSDKKVLDIDISKTKVTGTQWAEIARGLDKEIRELIDTSHPDFIHHYGRDVQMDDGHDWLKILENTPSVLQRPIIVNGDRYIQIFAPPDVKKFLDEESAQIEDN